MSLGVNIFLVHAGINGGCATVLQVGHKPQKAIKPMAATLGQNKLTVMCSVTVRVERLPAVGHTIVLSFSPSLTGTVRLFCSHPMRINIWLYVSIVKVRLGDHGRGQLV